MSMLLGNRDILSTTLHSLNNDRFELAHLKFKRLVCISDTPLFFVDLSIIKAITGGDTVPIRYKFANTAENYICIFPGRLIITGNIPLQTKDTSGALLRRLRIILINKKSSKSIHFFIIII